MSTKFGHMNKNSFISKHELLCWMNMLLKVEVTKIEQLGTGSIYCQILDCIYPGKVPLQKLKWKTKRESDFVNNLKILQQVFDNQKINKAVPIQKLAQAKYQDNLEFAQWIKRFFDLNCKEKGKDYDAVSRRNGIVPDLSFCGHGIPPKYTLVFRNGDACNKKIIIDEQQVLNELGIEQNSQNSQTSNQSQTNQNDKINLSKQNSSNFQQLKNSKQNNSNNNNNNINKNNNNNNIIKNNNSSISQTSNFNSSQSQFFNKSTPKTLPLQSGNKFFQNQNLNQIQQNLQNSKQVTNQNFFNNSKTPSACKFFQSKLQNSNNSNSQKNNNNFSSSLLDKEAQEQITKRLKLSTEKFAIINSQNISNSKKTNFFQKQENEQNKQINLSSSLGNKQQNNDNLDNSKSNTDKQENLSNTIINNKPLKNSLNNATNNFNDNLNINNKINSVSFVQQHIQAKQSASKKPINNENLSMNKENNNNSGSKLFSQNLSQCKFFSKIVDSQISNNNNSNSNNKSQFNSNLNFKSTIQNHSSSFSSQSNSLKPVTQTNFFKNA